MKQFNGLIIFILFTSFSFGQSNEVVIIQIENIGSCADNDGDIVIFKNNDSTAFCSECMKNPDISKRMVIYYSYSDSIFARLACLIEHSLDYDLNISDSLYANYNDSDLAVNPVPPGSFQIKLYDSNGYLLSCRVSLGNKSSRIWFKYLSSELKDNKYPISKEYAAFIANIPDLFDVICVEYGD